ncbi:very long chain fatty acid elongase 7-like isoform X2 [Dermacentor andersoni]|uniref:very long chain fatty acid elongase 7-like isoform X2 n=1 Tax=Dermacentor andersoni TaxID=34620 RepID=UPI00241705B2|nr:elongation of very long chain fatty acids protein 7-like isoform X2 [Dermacentor andersoni]
MEKDKENSRMNVKDSYSWFLPDRDPRVEGWVLIGSPVAVTTVLACYAYFVKIWGPRMMKNAKPFELRKTILFYNAAMVLANLAIATRVGYYAFVTGHYNLFLQGPDLSSRPTTMLLLQVSWWYLVLRLSECIETVFFVLRKKFNQVSGLHVFHHVSVSFCTYFYITYGGFSIACFETVFNASVHVLMYSYYFLAALGPQVQRHLWWKRYLTRLQLVQFIFMIVRNVCLVFTLGVPYFSLPLFMLSQCFIFFVQFLSFYIRSYKSNTVRLVKCGGSTPDEQWKVERVKAQ